MPVVEICSTPGSGQGPYRRHQKKGHEIISYSILFVMAPAIWTLQIILIDDLHYTMTNNQNS